jgi:hypothetical protein
MKRILMVLVVAALMAVMLVAMALPAFADAKPPNASCLGVVISGFAPESGQTVGENVRPFAKDGGVGDDFNKENRGTRFSGASPNC